MRPNSVKKGYKLWIGYLKYHTSKIKSCSYSTNVYINNGKVITVAYTFYIIIYNSFTGERGFWIYKMTDGIKSKREERECFFWYSFNIEKQIHHGLSQVLNDIRCPCDPRLLRFDPRYTINRFDKSRRLLCFASLTLGTNVVCKKKFKFINLCEREKCI